MSNDVLITPASRKIEFKDSSATVDAKIETDSNGNLVITNPGGDISLGDTTADVFIGDGANSVDIVFEQDGEIRGTSGVTITLGATGSNIRMASDLNLNSKNITNVNDITIAGNLTVNGATVTNSATNTTIEDALIELGSGNTGTNSNDLGLILERGTTGNNIFIGWDESEDKVAFGTTTATGSSTGNISYSRASILANALDLTNHIDIADNGKIRLGAGDDLQLHHDSTDSFMINYTGDLVIRNGATDKDIIFQSDDGSGSETTYFLLDGSNAKTQFNRHLKIIDNMQIQIGTNPDLLLYHDGSHSYIKSQGSGTLVIEGGGDSGDLSLRALDDVDIKVQNGELGARFLGNGAAELYYDNSKKLNTTSTGVFTTGFVASDHDMNASTPSSTNNNFFAKDTNALAAENGGAIVFSGIYTSAGDHLGVGPYVKAYKMNANSGDYGFGLKLGVRENGSGGSDVAMTINSSGNVGIGNTGNPVNALDVVGTIYSSGGIRIGSSSSGEGIFRYNPGNGAGIAITSGNFSTSGIRMFIAHPNDSGNVGIGTTSPATKLEVVGDITLPSNGQIKFKGTNHYPRIYASSNDLKINLDNGSGSNFEALGIDNATGAITFKQAYTFPTSDGSANQVLQTDGSGNLSFATVTSGAVDSIANFANNRVITASDADSLNGEANLTFDGSTLTVTGTLDVDVISNASGTVHLNDTLYFQDNSKAVFGDSSDLQLYHDGSNSYIANNTGNLQFDAANDIIIDAGGGDIAFRDDSVEFGRILNTSGSMTLHAVTQDTDILFRGNDGGSTITALTLDMSNAGAATFNNSLFLNGSTNSKIRSDGTTFFHENSNGNISLGPANTSYAHIQTDRPQFYFNKKLVVNEGIFTSYDEDAILRRASDSGKQITIGSTSISATLPFHTTGEGDSIGHAFNAEYYYDETVGDADGADNKWTLKDANGNDVTSTTTNKVYRVRLVTLGTGTNTGAVYLADNVDAGGWRVKAVSVHTSPTESSNYPLLEVDGGVPKVSIQHNSNYNVRIFIEEYNTGNNGGMYTIFGTDALLTYRENGGRIGIARETPGAKLDIGGNVAINGTEIMTSARNMLNIGSISSGAITSSGDIRANGGDYFTNSGAAGNYRGFGDRLGLSIVNGASYIYDAASSPVIALAAYTGNVHIYNELKMGNLSGTTVIDSSRNLVNIGTISSGAITATGAGLAPQLQIVDSDNTTGRLQVSHNGSTSSITSVGTSGLGTVTIGGSTTGTGSTYATFNSSGITSTALSIESATANLTLKDTSDDDDHQIYFKDNGGTVRYQITSAGDQFNFATSGSREIVFLPSDTEKFRIGTAYNESKQDIRITTGGLRIGSTTVIDSSRNLLSINNIDLTSELNFTGNGSKYIDFHTLANSNSINLRHHNPTGNLFETAAVFNANGGGIINYDGSARMTTRNEGIRVNSAAVGGVAAPTLNIGQLNNAYQSGIESSVHTTFKTTNSAGNFYFYRQSTIQASIIDGNFGIGQTTVIDSSRNIRNVPTAKLTGGTFSSGIDSYSNSALVIAKGNYIYSDDGSYLRNLIGQASDGTITIGQFGTSLISNIKLRPGSSGSILLSSNGSDSSGIQVGASAVTVYEPATFNEGITITDEISGDSSQFTINNGQGATMRMGITGSGSNEAAHIKTNAAEALEFHIGQASNTATPDITFLADGGGIAIQGTTVINSSRNLTNIVSYTGGTVKITSSSMIRNSGNNDLMNYSNNNLTVGDASEEDAVEVLNLTTMAGLANVHIDGNNEYVGFFGTGNSSYEARIASNGTMHLDSTLTQNSGSIGSDIKLKKNIQPIESALDTVEKLRGVHFEWKKSGKEAIGFIAQEVEEILPQLVQEADLLGEEDETFKSLDYVSIIPILVEAIKEQQKEIKELKEHSHPAKDMCEFDGYQELMARIKKLEENNGNN